VNVYKSSPESVAIIQRIVGRVPAAHFHREVIPFLGLVGVRDPRGSAQPVSWPCCHPTNFLTRLTHPVVCQDGGMTTFVNQITGVHPYADEFPMASEDELDDLTESIAAVGLIHPIVITPDGLILDGRNRLEACNRAEVEVRLEVREGTDDDYKEFVIGVNTTGRRESMTVQIAAASTALILGEERRRDGRWIGWTKPKNELATIVASSGERKGLERCGFVLDILGRDALRNIRDKTETLNAVYERAIETRDAERNKLAEKERLEAEETDAKAFIEANAPDLAGMVGSTYQTYAEALDIWKRRNREEAKRIAKEKADEAARQKAERENVEDQVRMVAGGLTRLQGAKYPQWRARTIAAFAKYPGAAPPDQVRLFTPELLRDSAQQLITLADELEATK
jgi:hypothetical protein